MSKNYINVSVSTGKPTRVSVSTPANQQNVDVTRDTSAYNAEIAKQWATSENLVLNEDYSSKYYANKSKGYAQNAENFESATRETYNSFVSSANSYIEELTKTKEEVTEEISMAASDGLLDIRNAKEEAVENVENVGADVIADIQENGKSLPMFTSIWTDHIYNDASYLRADTFSWQNADIYVTGYEILENEYNNENCVTETENGIEYRLSPNGFKIADASQSDAILNLYENGKNAWFYIIDTENRKFKLPREKSNEHKYLYFYVGNYSRPDTEINLGILAELANSQDLESVLASINEVKDNGIADIEATTASGVSSITTTANTGVNNINNATTAGVKTINDTTNAGKTAIQQIVNAGVPLATLETAGIVRPDGETITIVDGIISSAGGGGGWEVQGEGNDIALYNPDLRLKIFKIYVNKSNITVSESYGKFSGKTGNITFLTPFVGTPTVLGYNFTVSGVTGGFVGDSSVGGGVPINVYSTYYIINVFATKAGTASLSGYFTILGIV